jgi:tRNA(fMet)-specific endonuclease VapC
MAYILDTDIVIEHLRNNIPVTQMIEQLAGIAIYLSWATVAELYAGAFTSPHPIGKINAIRDATRDFTVLRPDDVTATRFAEIRSFLRRRGQLILDLDMIIAATAVQHDLTLITLNRRHFERIPDLRLYAFQ